MRWTEEARRIASLRGPVKRPKWKKAGRRLENIQKRGRIEKVIRKRKELWETKKRKEANRKKTDEKQFMWRLNWKFTCPYTKGGTRGADKILSKKRQNHPHIYKQNQIDV